MAGSSVQEWLSGNAHRRFPLAEDSDLSCPGGPMPDSVVLDARICLFGLPEETDGPVLLEGADVGADGSVALDMIFPGGTRSRLEADAGGVASFLGGDCSIRIVTGRALADWNPPVGSYRLPKPVEVLPSRVMRIPYGIGADRLLAGGREATGDVRVQDGENTTLSVRNNSLVLSVRRGIGSGASCPEEAPSDTCGNRILYYLAGQKADSSGNIDILGGDGVSVSVGTYMGIPAIIVHAGADAANFLYR